VRVVFVHVLLQNPKDINPVAIDPEIEGATSFEK
jgi:hypothetical protein